MSEPFNRQEILERVGGNRELLAELVNLMRLEWEQLRSAIELALQEADADALEKAAHQLKGAVSHFSASDPVGLSTRLEAAARENDMAAARAAAESLAPEMDRLLPALEDFAGESAE